MLNLCSVTLSVDVRQNLRPVNPNKTKQNPTRRHITCDLMQHLKCTAAGTWLCLSSAASPCTVTMRPYCRNQFDSQTGEKGCLFTSCNSVCRSASCSRR